MDRFQFSYQIEPDEVPAIVRYLQGRSPRIRRLMKIRIMTFTAAWAGTTLYAYVRLTDFERVLVYSACLLLLFGLAFLLSIRVDRWWWSSNLKGSPHFMAQREVVVDDAGIASRTESTETKYAWSTIQKVDSTPDFFFLFVDNDAAIPIPRRIFASDVEAEYFWRATESYCRKG